MSHFAPPPGPPAFLSFEDLERLATYGHLPITLPTTLRNDLDAFFSAADEFFQLSLETKQKLYPGPKTDFELGYHDIATEKQYISFRHASRHEQSVSIEDLVGPLWYDIVHLLYRVLVDIGNFLEIDNNVWLPIVWGSLQLPPSAEAMRPTLLRVFRYEPESGIADPHTDVGLLTLCIGKGKGLQVWEPLSKPQLSNNTDQASDTNDPIQNGQTNGTSNTSSTSWRDAGEVCLLVGDMLSMLSTRRLLPGRHRVIGNPEGRDSIVFALRSDLDTTIDLQAFGGTGLLYMKNLWRQICDARVNVNKPKATRDELREKNRQAAAKRKLAEQSTRSDGQAAEINAPTVMSASVN